MAFFIPYKMATKIELENEVKLLRNELETYRTSEHIIDIIYPNVEKFVQWEEMKYSLRSLEKNLTGVKIRIWIVGELPAWINTDEVNFIQVEYSGETPRIDILHKHLAVINHQDIGEEYFWMNDDIYLVNKVMYADMCLPVAVNDLRDNVSLLSPQTIWGRDNIRTLKLLQQEGLTTWNYGVHIPHRFEKSKLKHLIEKYAMLTDPIVLTQLYYNYWFREFHPYWDSLDLKNNQGFCINRPNPNWANIKAQLQVKKYMNNSEAGMSPDLQKLIKDLFPDPSRFEK
jgi:hypothetical protein